MITDKIDENFHMNLIRKIIKLSCTTYPSFRSDLGAGLEHLLLVTLYS